MLLDALETEREQVKLYDALIRSAGLAGYPGEDTPPFNREWAVKVLRSLNRLRHGRTTGEGPSSPTEPGP